MYIVRGSHMFMRRWPRTSGGGRHMKIASKPSLIPSVEEDTAVIQTWGEKLESYVPKDNILLCCDKDDMRRILDMQGARVIHKRPRGGTGAEDVDDGHVGECVMICLWSSSLKSFFSMIKYLI